jgi:hypothetical protein
MELNFTEYDNYKDNNLENDYSKYWEQPKTEKKKKVSFNDILTNMNLVVGKNGVLQQMQHQAVEEQPQYLPQPQQYLPQPQQQYITKKQEQYLPQQKEQYNIKKIEENQVPIDPSVKHSFIYNKYFKDYVDAYKPEPEVLVPRTMEEYRQMVYEQKVKEAEERKRISEIKSTKLMFTTNKGYENANNGKNPANIRPSKNNLRMMNFR